MKPRLIGSILILIVILALVLPGAYGASINIRHNGGTISAQITTALGGTASATGLATSNTGNVEFKGTDAKKVQICGRWDAKRTSTFSEVGLLLKNADSYDAIVNGHQSDVTQKTDASLDLSTSADYVDAYAKSGTAKKYEAGVDMTVAMGSADVNLDTAADGGARSASAQFTTDPTLSDTIIGDHIDTHGWFKGGVNADVNAHVDDGLISAYAIAVLTGNSIGGQVYQKANGPVFDDINGQYVKLTTSSSGVINGMSKEIKASTEITNGGVIGYSNGVTYAPTSTPSYIGGQGFVYANTGSDKDSSIAIDNKYTQSLYKTQIESKATVNGPGAISLYGSSIDADPSITQGASYANAGVPNHQGGVSFDESYTRSGLYGLGTQTFTSHTSVGNGEIDGYSGASGTGIDPLHPTEVGTENSFDNAYAEFITIDDLYTTSLPVLSKYYKEAKVTGTDGLFYNNGADLLSNMLNVHGASTFDPSLLPANPNDVKIYGQITPDTTDGIEGMTVHADAWWKYNNHLSDGFNWNDPTTFNNFFIANADPFAGVGHLVTNTGGDTQFPGADSIQAALNNVPSLNDNDIYLLDATYTGNGNIGVDNSKVAGTPSFNLYGAGYWMGDPSQDSTIDACYWDNILNLYSNAGSNDNTFNIRNVDFNNGLTRGSGGAIIMSQTGGHNTEVNIYDSNFNNNWAESNGGAIYNYYGTLNTHNTNFNSNEAYQNAGGAIESEFGIVNVDGGAFSHNDAYTYGGAINIYAGSLTTKGVDFEGNWYEKYGGAAAVSNGATYTSTDDTFNCNSAFVNGGAIWEDTGAQLYTNYDTFTNNVAGDLKGGAIKYHGVWVDTGSTFSGNSPDDYDNL